MTVPGAFVLGAHSRLPRDRRKKNRGRQLGGWIMLVTGIIMAVLLVFGLISLLGNFYQRREITTLVVSKERVCDSSSDRQVSCKYLIFTEAGTYKIVDSLFGAQRFNSSDVYGRVRPEHCYRLKVYGWRMPFFSSYENVDKLTEVPCAGA